MSGESRTELLNWLNSTLNLNYKKVEQCGTGAVYCQIFDSIFQDLPMNKVKYDATSEYQYLNNFKILQSAFSKHRIEKTIMVERLIKCKFQDNLEFLQWMKKFWMDNKDDTDYDPDSRRILGAVSVNSNKGPSNGRLSSASNGMGLRTNSSSSRRSISDSRQHSDNRSNSVNGTRSSNVISQQPRSRISSINSNGGTSSGAANGLQSQKLLQLQKELNETTDELNSIGDELNEYKIAAEGLETERNFYFNKLREIEILTQNSSDLLKQQDDEGVIDRRLSIDELLKQIQEILYSTEEGFQVPDQENDAIMMDEETF